MSLRMSFEARMNGQVPAAIEKVTAALAEEGFGVLTRIDVHETFKKKLDADFRPYVILGACNPSLAHKALCARAEVGLMLPCNVTVEQDGDGALVRFVDPAVMLQMGDFAEDPELGAVAEAARGKLQRVCRSLG